MIPTKTSVEFGSSKTVQDEWNKFSQRVFYGISPGAIQQEEMQASFYAGFYSSLAVCFSQIAESETEESGAVMFENLKKECEDFFKKKLKDYLQSKN